MRRHRGVSALREHLSGSRYLCSGGLRRYTRNAGLAAGTFQVVLSPSGTPKNVLGLLQSATAEIMHDPVFQGELETLMFEPVTDSTPERTHQFIRAELAQWAPIVKAG